MYKKNKHIKIVQSILAACFAALVLASASASDLPTEKLKALECTNAASESCCEKWVKVVLAAARAEANPGSMLTVLPRRVDRWVIIEKRNYCDIRKDIEARAL
jgi:hypothetical protein